MHGLCILNHSCTVYIVPCKVYCVKCTVYNSSVLCGITSRAWMLCEEGQAGSVLNKLKRPFVERRTNCIIYYILYRF